MTVLLLEASDPVPLQVFRELLFRIGCQLLRCSSDGCLRLRDYCSGVRDCVA